MSSVSDGSNVSSFPHNPNNVNQVNPPFRFEVTAPDEDQEFLMMMMGGNPSGLGFDNIELLTGSPSSHGSALTGFLASLNQRSMSSGNASGGVVRGGGLGLDGNSSSMGDGMGNGQDESSGGDHLSPLQGLHVQREPSLNSLSSVTSTNSSSIASAASSPIISGSVESDMLMHHHAGLFTGLTTPFPQSLNVRSPGSRDFSSGIGSDSRLLDPMQCLPSGSNQMMGNPWVRGGGSNAGSGSGGGGGGGDGGGGFGAGIQMGARNTSSFPSTSSQRSQLSMADTHHSMPFTLGHAGSLVPTMDMDMQMQMQLQMPLHQGVLTPAEQFHIMQMNLQQEQHRQQRQQQQHQQQQHQQMPPRRGSLGHQTSFQNPNPNPNPPQRRGSTSSNSSGTASSVIPESLLSQLMGQSGSSVDLGSAGSEDAATHRRNSLGGLSEEKGNQSSQT
jgi:hypothetical protein